MFDLCKYIGFRRRLHKAMETYHRLEDPWSAEHVKPIIGNYLKKQCGECPQLLEVGSGDGVITEVLASLADHIDCVEISQRAVRKAKKRHYCAEVAFFCKDIHAFRFRKNYDLILLSYVVEYLGFDAFPKKFVWLLMAMTKHTKRIILIQPIQGEENLKRLHRIVVILNQCGFRELHKELNTETTPDLFLGTYIPMR